MREAPQIQMKKNSQKSAKSYLQNSENKLGSLVAKTQQLKQLEYAVLNHLDHEIREHCFLVNLRQGILILGTNSPHFASLLRFQLPDLLEKLRKHNQFYHIQSIKCKVIPQIMPSKKSGSVNSPATLSRTAGEHIKALADSMKNSRIKAILERLAGRSE